MKKWMALLLCACMLLCTLPTFAEETRVFLDSSGREVTVPTQITKVAVTGPIAQYYVFALAPEALVALADYWDESASQYIPEEYVNLTKLGQIYGGKTELNLETLLMFGPDIILDVGTSKKTIAEDMDDLQSRTGIPCVHIEARLESLGEAYRAMGDLLNRPEEAEALADYCENAYARVKAISEKVEKVNLLYVLGGKGLNVIAKDSYHAEIIDMLCNNLAALDEPSSKGTGNEVDMEQILRWNPDYVLFAPDSVYETVADDPGWQGVTAIARGTYAEVPMGPTNWMGFPPAAHRLLGMLWMAKLLYPEEADYDLYEETARFFTLFWHTDLTPDQYETLMENSFFRP